MTDWTKYGQEDTDNAAPPALRPVDDSPAPASEESETDAQDWTTFADPAPETDTEVEEYFDYEEDDEDDTEGEEESKPDRSRISASDRRALIIIPAVLVTLLVGAGFAGWAALRGMSGDTNADAEAVAQTTQAVTTESAAPSTAETVEPGKPEPQERMFGSCESSGKQVTPDQSTSYGAIAAFQRAYYAHDVEGVRKVLSPSAPLQKQDWNSVFAKLGDDSTFCVKMQPATAQGTQVPTTLTVGNKTYEQIVTVVNTGSDWSIQKIEKA